MLPPPSDIPPPADPTDGEHDPGPGDRPGVGAAVGVERDGDEAIPRLEGQCVRDDGRQVAVIIAYDAGLVAPAR
jgi:hypothetical protein